MAKANLTPCNVVGCPELVRAPTRYCEKHEYKNNRHHVKKRRVTDTWENREARAFYNSGPWRKCRRAQLQREPLCRVCESVAQMVDHIVPLSEGGEPFTIENLQSLCNRCHNRKRQRERFK